MMLREIILVGAATMVVALPFLAMLLLITAVR